jgi:hypothetical protein
MKFTIPIPAGLESVRQDALKALGPVIPSNSKTQAEKNFLLISKRSSAGRNLPPYYLVYFLLVDFLGFKNLGQWEKIAWSVPIDFNGEAYLIEHRKFGVGVFVRDPPTQEDSAEKIVEHINKAVNVSQPFFDWLATQAMDQSKVNVVNNSEKLFQRYEYLLGLYLEKLAEAERRKDDHIVEEGKSSGGSWQKISYPSHVLHKESEWLAISAIEAFFSWSEHALIHVAILIGNISTARSVADIAKANWSDKCKAALDITSPIDKLIYDKMLTMRDELRNYVAHGAFGKQGEDFSFHSGAGAVPVLLPHKLKGRTFTLGSGLVFNLPAALSLTEEFIKVLWSGRRAPARIYIQDSQLPIILTHAADGSYTRAMASIKHMDDFISELTEEWDRAANMDW